MKKVLSFLLVLMLSLTVAGISQESGAVAADATIYIHVLEHDGDYTTTGTGLWDGVNWNGWGDTADANGVITIEYTTAEIAAVDDSIQFKPVGNTTDPDNTLLAYGNGEVMLDVTDLKDGTITELHAYFVEDTKAFYVKEKEANGIAFIYYVNPKIASEEDAYTDWGMHIWDAGTESNAAGTEWSDPYDFYTDFEIGAGEYTVGGKLGVIEVDDDALATFGFIVHKGDDKAYSSDIRIDTTVTKAGGVELLYYLHGTDGPVTDFSAYTTDVAVAYKDALKNKFIAPTAIVSPNTIDATFFSKKQPWELLPGLFTVKDSAGTAMPIEDIIIPGAVEVGKYDSVVEEKSQTIVVLYVDSTEAIADMGIAGNFQGWSPENATTSTTTDANGYYVFELATFGSSAEFLVLVEDGVDDVETTEVDESTVLSWSDTKISGDNNLVVDTSNGGTIHVYFDDATNDYYVQRKGAVVDSGVYTYTADTSCEDNLVTLFVHTDIDHTKLGLVGTINGWDVGGALPVAGETTEGVPYWEVCTTDMNGEFKVKHDPDGDGFTWDSGTDPEVTPQNIKFMVTDGAANVIIYPELETDLGHTAVLQPEYIYELTIYFLGLDDAANAGVIGSFQGWDDEDIVLPTLMDGFGNYILETSFSNKTETFKVLVDNNGDGLDAMDATTVDSYEISLDEELNTIYVFDMSDFSLTPMGTTIVDEANTFTNFQIVIEDEFMYDGVYTIEYIEVPAVLDDAATTEVDESVPAEVLTWDLGFTTAVEIVEPDVVEEMGTYAVSPTELTVQFTTMQDLFAMNDVLALYDEDDNMISVADGNYMLSLGSMEYDATVACDAPGNLVFLHFNATTEIEDLTHIGLVGSIQVANDWTPAEAINPTGMDSDGYYVFEVCLPETDEEVALKILHDAEADFDWGDTQLISSDVTMVVADGPHFYIEEGLSQLNTSTTHKIMLSAPLDKTKSYYLALEDASGFTIKVDLLMDTEAPTVTATIDPAASFTIENTVTFDVNDYFTVLNFVDNREGEMSFTVKTALDFTALGSQTMTIAATDMWGNEGTYDIVFTVVDTTDPELVIEDAKEYEAGTTAPDWATFATSSDGTITVDAADVDMDTAGVYYVNYTAKDAANNETLGTLEVTITAGETTDTGCFGSFSLGSSIGLIVAAIAGGTVLFFVRKQK